MAAPRGCVKSPTRAGVAEVPLPARVAVGKTWRLTLRNAYRGVAAYGREKVSSAEEAAAAWRDMRHCARRDARRDWTAFKDHADTPHLKRAMPRINALLASPLALEIYLEVS